ncbi:acetyltransferase [Aphanothece hegewaldii CCALA 016]|uniref:Acetyltransferase n=1 Tax=Aphanothece hegewaldii CCALA 016 TaxID=2107694 RepID=A0A2T1LYF4_9CHRO|nr:acetyltransferase [Aphanothece hegewaldii]PSF37427.1 acetyltransferase [Aphanothece hegewaldii CCALA 016]
MSENQTTPASTTEITEAIAELEAYRERLLSETLTAAQRAKLPKSQTLAQLEPELAKIDSVLEALRSQQQANN